MKALRNIIVGIVLVASLAYSSLLWGTAAMAQPPDVNAARVWVDPQIDEHAYLHDLIANQLEPADDIAVTIETTGPAYVKQDATHLVVFLSKTDRSIAVYANSEAQWPDQETAIEILSESAGSRDMVARTLQFIRQTHQWQQENPIDG